MRAGALGFLLLPACACRDEAPPVCDPLPVEQGRRIDAGSIIGSGYVVPATP